MRIESDFTILPEMYGRFGERAFPVADQLTVRGSFAALQALNVVFKDFFEDLNCVVI